jgi:hypothetical protein
MSLELLQRVASSTTAAHLDGFSHPWTPARLRKHPTIALLMQNKERSSITSFDQGYELKWKLDGSVQTDFESAQMGSDYSWGATGEMSFLRAPIRESRWSESIFAHEISFGARQAFSSGAAGYWDILKKKNLNFDLGPIDRIEAVDLWRTPVAAMQGGGLAALPIYSIPSFINQWTEDMGTVGNGVPPGFTSQLGLLPGDLPDPHRVNAAGDPESLLACQQVGYADGASGVVGSGNTTVPVGHILERLARLVRACNYDVVPMVSHGEAGEMKALMRGILCSDHGEEYLWQTIRANGDKAVITDPSGTWTRYYGNIPIMGTPALNFRALYPDTTAGTDVAGAADRAMVDEFNTAGFAGPRYYLPDANALDIVMHADGMWNTTKWRFLDQINRDRMVKDGRLWWQLRMKQFVTSGILFPTEDQDRFAA